MTITEEDAKIIIQMALVCCNEGIGPDYDDLLKRIRAAFGIPLPIEIQETP